MKRDVYERITGKIVAELEKGVRPWMQPWSAGNAEGRIVRPLRANGIPYRGINVLMLWAESIEKGYASPIWMAFKQALELNAHIRKGEHSSLIVYASKITRTETDAESGEDSERDIPFLKGYTVFNVEQIDGLPAHFHVKPELERDPVARIAHADAFANATAAITHGAGRAYYTTALDRVQMPPFKAFRDAPSYYATLIHELTHYAEVPIMPRRSLRALRTGHCGHSLSA